MKPTTRTFHCTEAGSSKFWTIATAPDSKTFTVTFGKIGTAGQSKEKLFPTADQCAREAEKLIREKTGKGYIEQGAAPAAPGSAGVPPAGSSGTGPSGTGSQPVPPSTENSKPQTVNSPTSSSSPPAPGPFPGTTIVAKATSTKRFTKAQGKAAYETFLTLDRAAIDAIIATGIPLDEKIFGERSTSAAVDALIMQLFANGADPLQRKIDLAIAAYADLPRTLAHLLETHLAAGYKINEPDNYGQPILNRAHPRHRTTEILLAAGMSAKKTPELVSHAAIHYPHAAFRRLIETHKLSPETLDNDGNTPLLAAEAHAAKNPDAVTSDLTQNITYLRALRGTGSSSTGDSPVPPVTENRKPKTVNSDAAPASSSSSVTAATPALLTACKQPEATQTNALARALKQGANPNIRDTGGLTPLHHIAAQKYPHIIKEGLAHLIAAGADPRSLDDENRTPLFHFFTGYHGDIDAARALVTAGIDPAHKDRHGRNALAHMLATAPIEKDHDARQTTAALIAAGVPATDCDAHGNTALHLIVTHQKLGGEARDLIALALEKGAPIDARNTAGRTPLHAAVMRPENDRHTFFDYLVKELLRNKADINAQDPDGNTPIHLSADPGEDLDDLLAARPDLALANKKNVTVLQHIKNLGYHDAKKHARFAKAIDALIAAPVATRQLPPLTWKPAPINLNAPPPLASDNSAVLSRPPAARAPGQDKSSAPLQTNASGDAISALPRSVRIPHSAFQIVSSFHIQTNDADDDFVHIGANRLAITGNIPADLVVFDTAKGEIIWTLREIEDGARSIAYDGHTVFVARESSSGGSRYLTAHHPDTGAELWHCGLSSSYKQFGTRLVCTANYVVHASQSAGKLYPIHKKTGKKYIAPLINPYPQQKTGNRHDWGARYEDPRWRYDSLIPCADDTLLVLGVKPKQHTIAIDQYDLAAKGAHQRTLIEMQTDVQPTAHHVRDGFLYLFNTHGELQKIELATGDTHSLVTAQDTDADENVQHTYAHKAHCEASGKLHYILARNCDDLHIHNTYDFATDTVVRSHLIKKGLPLPIHKPAPDGQHIYCFGEDGAGGREIYIYDLAAKKITAQLTLPNYGGYDWAEKRLVLGDAIYVLQKGGHEHGEDTAILHRIQ